MRWGAEVIIAVLPQPPLLSWLDQYKVHYP